MHVSKEFLSRAGNLIGKVLRVRTESEVDIQARHLRAMDVYDQGMIEFTQRLRNTEPILPETFFPGGRKARRSLIITVPLPAKGG